jgi:hypothetical protein
LVGKVVNGKPVGIKRLVNVINGNPSNCGQMLDFNPLNAANIDIISVAPYLGGDRANKDEFNVVSVTNDAGEVIRRMRALIPALMSNTLAMKNYATSRNMDFDMYEGLFETVAGSANVNAISNFTASISGNVMTATDCSWYADDQRGWGVE